MNCQDCNAPAVLCHADWRDIDLPAVDHIITDPPFSEATHVGHNASVNGHIGAGKDSFKRAGLPYDSMTPSDVINAVYALSARCRGWFVWMTDHHLAPHVSESMRSAGRYVFAPLPFVAPGSRVRLSGDGPSSWTIWIVVSRPPSLSRWGTLPGAYIASSGWREREYPGGKPIALLDRLVRDYSRRGDIILDPYMGHGSTGVAAVNAGRNFVGIEISEAPYLAAAERIEMAQRQESLFA